MKLNTLKEESHISAAEGFGVAPRRALAGPSFGVSGRWSVSLSHPGLHFSRVSYYVPKSFLTQREPKDS